MTLGNLGVTISAFIAGLCLSSVWCRKKSLPATASKTPPATEAPTADTNSLQAQKMEALGRLASGVSHDFNNLLTAINGYSDLLLNTLPAQDPNRELVEEIRKAGDKGSALTQQLLSFSRKQQIELRGQDLRPLVRELEKLLSRLLGNGIQLQMELGEETISARVDAHLLEQAILNLAVNARDAMLPKGGTVTLTVRHETVMVQENKGPLTPTPGPKAVIAVSDTGTGIDPSLIPRLFEPFFTTKTKGKGTGLGLSTVFGIVQQLGGGIRVESTLGKGTTFSLLFPIAKPDRPDLKQEETEAPRGQGEAVLVIESDANLRELMARILEEGGYQPTRANSLAQAEVAKTQTEFALQILGVAFAHEEGQRWMEQALLSRAAKQKENRFLCLYHEDVPSLIPALRGAPIHWLSKPFTRLSLLQAVQRGLKSAS